MKTKKIQQKKPVQDISFGSAQDKQDEIFRKMSAGEKIELGFQLWELGKALSSDKINYAPQKSKRAFSEHSQGS